jgi:hypothetical protein
VDSHIKDFNKIPDNIWTLSLRNSNFEDFQYISHLQKLEYLDVSYLNIKSIHGLSKLKSLKILNFCCVTFIGENEVNEIYQEILNLENLELLIIDKKNAQLIFGEKLTNRLLENKIIELPNNHNIGHISSSEIVEIFKIAERVKIQNDALDFWNTQMNDSSEDNSCELKIDYKFIKEKLQKELSN